MVQWSRRLTDIPGTSPAGVPELDVTGLAGYGVMPEASLGSVRVGSSRLEL
jgi:hypothetical protein